MREVGWGARAGCRDGWRLKNWVAVIRNEKELPYGNLVISYIPILW